MKKALSLARWASSASLLIMVCACDNNSVQIEAIEPLPVFASLSDSNTTHDARAIMHLESGERAGLSACIDIKSDIVYRIRLADGREGYINGVRPYRFVEGGREIEHDDAC
ncbi:MAG: hypothetical protein KF800_11520 [Lysobacter sp.]|nr:hypothetical protein [Lysobacter sp.]